MFDIFISDVLKVLIHFIELKKFSRMNMLEDVASVVSNVGMLYLVVFLFIMLESPLISTFLQKYGTRRLLFIQRDDNHVG